MRLTWLFVLVGACHFDHGAAPLLRDDGAVPPPDTSQDAQSNTEPDAAIDAMPSRFCDSAGGTLVACYEFEDTTQDGSGHHLDATMTNVTFPGGKVGKAMQFDTTSAADVGETPMFDLNALTIEAWIRPTQLPASGQRAGIVDNNGQYGLFYNDSGRLQCTLSNGASLGFDANIPTNTWTHVACTYDGASAALLVNGRTVVTAANGGMLATNGTTGISIAADNPPGAGSRLVGKIDQLRIFSVARTEAEICEAADGDDCD